MREHIKSIAIKKDFLRRWSRKIMIQPSLGKITNRSEQFNYEWRIAIDLVALAAQVLAEEQDGV